MKKRVLFIAVLIMLIASLFAGCAMDGAELPREGVSIGEIITSSSPNRKIIYTVITQVETANFEQTVDKINEELDINDGYIESSNIYTEYGKQYIEYVLRVKTDNLSQFLEEISEDNEVLYQTVISEDITNQYYNAKAEKDAYEREIQLLEEMLQEEDISNERIEYLTDRITETNKKLNALTNRIAAYEELVEYSKVELYLYEVGSQVPELNSYGEKVGNAFKESLKALLSVLEFLSLVVVVLIPFAAVALAVLFGVKYLLKYLRKRWPEKFDKKKKKGKNSYENYYQDFLKQKQAQQAAKADAQAKDGDGKEGK